MERCYECGKRDWRIGSTYQAIRNWFRLKVGLDKPSPGPSPEVAAMLARSSAVFKYMAEQGSLPKAGERVTWRPRQFYDTNKGHE